MGFGGHRRLKGAILAPAALLAGCGPWDPALEPPRVVQISCRPVGAPSESPPRIYVLDTGAGTAAWANAPGDGAGVLSVERDAYAFVFDGHAGRVNRYDGRMVLQAAQGPVQPSGADQEDDGRGDWTCVPQAEGPQF